MNPNRHAEMNHGHPYTRLAVMAGLSFLFMYALMYAMVDVFGNVFHNLNQVYMAGLMAAPMVALELLLMASMYPNKKANVALLVASLIVGAVFFGAIRRQSGITDAQFLRSMIPHHAGAILMCRETPASDPEIRELCRGIIAGQQAEIDQMKALLDGMQGSRSGIAGRPGRVAGGYADTKKGPDRQSAIRALRWKQRFECL